MGRWKIVFLVALSVLVISKESAGQTGRLAGLEEIRVVVESLGRIEDKTRLNRGDLTIHTLALLKEKVPRLVIKGTAKSFIYINARLAVSQAGGRTNNYFGAVWVGVYRPVIIKKTGLPVSAMVWYRAQGVEGILAGARDYVQQTLERILIVFATEWSRDNPGQ